MPRPITPRTTLELLKREAKRWLKALRDNVSEARARLERATPNARQPVTLRDVQHALAREHGMSGWAELRARLAPDAPMRFYEAVADALVTAYRTPDPEAVRIVWRYFGHMRAWDAMRRYIRLDLGKTEMAAPGELDEVTLDEARFLVARAQGHDSWHALEAAMAKIGHGSGSFVPKAVGGFRTRSDGDRYDRTLTQDWDELFALMREHQLPGLHPNGQMTDALLERFTRLDQITDLDLSGCGQVTDAGLRYLARLPRLSRLNLSGCNFSEHGLAVLRDLPALTALTIMWTRVSDGALAPLADCPGLESVDLSGTPTGDGAIRALAGKESLRDFRSGNGVTDAGLALLRELPVFRSWRGGTEEMHLTGYDARPNYLLLRGLFTDAGCAAFRDLEGLFALNIDSDQMRVTGAGLLPLQQLPHFSWLAFAAKDESMPAIAALPRLRFLMCQDTPASDAGWVSLGASRSIEYIWGRRCHGLQRAGFQALSRIPTIRSLSVSCKNVDDLGLAALPEFPMLEELMPMDVPDAGYRHVGQCQKLSSLVLMYCRDTGDEATSHITALPRLVKYFVSYNLITDRTPELLATIPTLEEVTIDTCAGVTNRGVGALAALPRLRKLRVSGMPMVTPAVKAVFASGVEVSHGL